MLKFIIPEKYWHRLFEATILLKAFNGVWETISGSLFLMLTRQTFYEWFAASINNEIIENPRDFVMSFLAHTLRSISSDMKVFAAVYLLVHGVLNLYLSVQLYRQRYWAYLVTIGVTLVFMTYQLHRIVLHHSLFLIALTTFDAIYIMLTWHEYKRHVLQHLP